MGSQSIVISYTCCVCTIPLFEEHVKCILIYHVLFLDVWWNGMSDTFATKTVFHQQCFWCCPKSVQMHLRFELEPWADDLVNMEHLLHYIIQCWLREVQFSIASYESCMMTYMHHEVLHLACLLNNTDLHANITKQKHDGKFFCISINCIMWTYYPWYS